MRNKTEEIIEGIGSVKIKKCVYVYDDKEIEAVRCIEDDESNCYDHVERGYKVVGFKVWDVDAWESPIIRFGRCQYPLHHWATPNEECGPLTVFDYLEDAEEMCVEWINNHWHPGPFLIFECLYVPSEEETVYSTEPWSYGKDVTPVKDLGIKTRIAEKVMLLLEVENYSGNYIT